MSKESERSAWRFLGFAALFVLAFVGLIALGTLLLPGERWVPNVVGTLSVMVLFLLWQRSRKGRDDDSAL